MLCSDGSDPLRNETSGEIISCGAGIDIDGQAHCERGFYCSIDPDSNSKENFFSNRFTFLSSFLLSFTSTRC